jgi:hypothetical protein
MKAPDQVLLVNGLSKAVEWMNEERIPPKGVGVLACIV